jgi:hypothetical protein
VNGSPRDVRADPGRKNGEQMIASTKPPAVLLLALFVGFYLLW